MSRRTDGPRIEFEVGGVTLLGRRTEHSDGTGSPYNQVSIWPSESDAPSISVAVTGTRSVVRGTLEVPTDRDWLNRILDAATTIRTRLRDGDRFPELDPPEE